MKTWQMLVAPAIGALCSVLSAQAPADVVESDTMAAKTHEGTVVLLYPNSCESRYPELIPLMTQSPPYNSAQFQYAELWVPEEREGQSLRTFVQEGCWAMDALTEEAFVYTNDGLAGIWEASKLTPMHRVGVAALSLSPKVSH